MKAYAILAGGGVRGAALAGCLGAASHHEVEFVGYAGASAGAAVALLAAVGFSGMEIRHLLKTRLRPGALLGDDGKKLSRLKADARAAVGPFRPAEWIRPRTWMGGVSLIRCLSTAREVLDRGGLYDGDLLKEALETCVRERLPKLPPGEITFAKIFAETNVSLKILSSDITKSRAVLHPEQGKFETESVLRAVQASMCFPLLFRPVVLPDGRRLVDGGLSSNLPTVLFASEHEQTRYPLLAFDLAPRRDAIPMPYGPIEFGKDLLSTALEASDNLFISHVRGIHRIPVKTPQRIGTFKFDLTDDDVDALYDAGYREAGSFLGSFDPLRHSKQAGLELQKQLRAVYGDPKRLTPVLSAVIQAVMAHSLAKDVRALIMLPTGRRENTRIVAYGAGYRDTDNDRDLELDEFEGCSGAALRMRRPVIADLTNLTSDQRLPVGLARRVPTDRRSMLSVPIFVTGQSARPPILGILTVDSSTSLADTDWIPPTKGGSDLSVRKNIVEIVTTWADILSRVLQ